MSRKIICSRCGKIVDVNHDCPNKPRDTRKREQLSDVRWQRTKQIVKTRDLVCYLCWCEGKINHARDCHHIIPREVNDSDDSIYNADNCIYLCEYCHRNKVHATKNSWRDYVDIFKKHIEEVKHGGV